MRKILYFFLIGHIFAYKWADTETKRLIDEDICEMNCRCKLNKGLLYYLSHEKPYRNLFYFRIRKYPIVRFLRRIIKEYPLFTITPNTQRIGGGAFVLNHPYSTIINAKEVGDHFTVCQMTTIGNAFHGRNDLIPIIGSNVSLGANVTIIGDIRIGNNVVIGAGAVVVKDVPDNCVIVGNPAHIIKTTIKNK